VRSADRALIFGFVHTWLRCTEVSLLIFWWCFVSPFMHVLYSTLYKLGDAVLTW
jgi:hypothetical protein